MRKEQGTYQTMADGRLTRLIRRVDQAQLDMVLEVADHSLLTIASLVSKDSIDLSPQFQRRDRWDTYKQSALIESFLLNIPVPPIYLAEGEEGVFSVIDGKQRISAIRDFYEGGLALTGLERLPEAEGLNYVALPRTVQSKLDKRPIRAVTILRQSTPELKHEVFLRLNRAGEVLNPQEIRNVAYRGPLNDLIYRLSENPFLRRQIKAIPPKSPNYRNMLDAELTLRFFTLREGWEGFSGDLRWALDSFMANNQYASPDRLGDLQREFTRCIKGAEAIWGGRAFRRPGGRDEAVAGMFDSEMVALSLLTDRQIGRLASRSSDVWSAMLKLMEDEKFETAVRVGTNTPSRVRYRINTLSKLLREF